MECDWLEAVKSFGTIIIGVAASIIAYQQHKTNKDKLRLDLFEKRFALYNSLYESWTATLNGRQHSIGFSENVKIYREAYFLFGEEVTTYIHEFHRRLFKYTADFNRLESMNRSFRESQRDNSERIPLIDKTDKMRSDLFQEVQSLEKLFRPYIFFGVKN